MFTLLSLIAWALLFACAHKHPIHGVPRGLRGGGGDDNTEVEIPSYSKPPAAAFNLFGNKGSYDSATNTYNAELSPDELITYNTAKKIRNDLLGSLGLGGTSTDPYAQTFLNESLRTTSPRLENSLIGRGIAAGTPEYNNALTDLYSKLGTQAILQGRTAKLNDLTALQNYLGGQGNLGQYLLTATQGNDVQQQNLAQQMYLATLPYYAKVTQNQGTDWGGIGSALGMVGGLGLSALLPGSQIAFLPALGSIAGGSIGGAF